MPWYVVDHDDNDRTVRGPFEHPETAAAVRVELERPGAPYETRGNLWIAER